MKRLQLYTFWLALFIGCKPNNKESVVDKADLPEQFIVVLGITQDAGYPQIGCTKECCKRYWDGKEEKKHITCLALIDQKSNKYWLLEATPDIAQQVHTVQSYLEDSVHQNPAGIFITHAHIGHYTGLMELGREAMGAKRIPVWAMPRMDSFLRNNGPWSQLVKLGNIELKPLQADSTISLDNSFTVTPILVPHRDEYSETVGFVIKSSRNRVLFIPDIDKWEKWNRSLPGEIFNVHLAIVDGTFFGNGELPGRDMKEVPHPFVEESLSVFNSLNDSVRTKIMFIHFNHTNPLLRKGSAERKRVEGGSFSVAEEGMVINM